MDFLSLDALGAEEAEALRAIVRADRNTPAEELRACLRRVAADVNATIWLGQHLFCVAVPASRFWPLVDPGMARELLMRGSDVYMWTESGGRVRAEAQHVLGECGVERARQVMLDLLDLVHGVTNSPAR